MSWESRDLKGLLLLFLLELVGLALTPTVQEFVLNVTHTNASDPNFANNLTGASRTLMALVPLFWIILVLAIGTAGVIVWLKR